MDVNDVVAAKVEAARLRAEAAKLRRAAFAAARKRGLAIRNAAKLRHLSVRATDGTVTETVTTATTTEENQ
jgi:hypothetical protein